MLLISTCAFLISQDNFQKLIQVQCRLIGNHEIVQPGRVRRVLDQNNDSGFDKGFKKLLLTRFTLKKIIQSSPRSYAPQIVKATPLYFKKKYYYYLTSKFFHLIFMLLVNTDVVSMKLGQKRQQYYTKHCEICDYAKSPNDAYLKLPITSAP